MLETKIHQSEINVEVNGMHVNDTTLLRTHNNGQEHANTQLISTDKTTEKQEGSVPVDKSTSGSPPCNSSGTRPKSKSFLWEKGGWVTGRPQHPQICDETGWPPLSSSSTP